MARFTRSTRKWVRGFDWDFAQSTANLNNLGITYDWVRVPSDTVDPLAPDNGLVPAKTLVKTLIGGRWECTAIPNGAAVDFYFGIIRWSAQDGAVSLGSNVPDVTNGALDWIAWLPSSAFNNSGVATTYSQDYGGAGVQGFLLEFSSQRKLPPGEGVLWVASFAGVAGSTASLRFNARIGLKGDVTAVGLGGG